MFTKNLAAAIAAVSILGASAQAATQTFTDRADFLAATTSFVTITDTFDRDIESDPTITFDSGVVSSTGEGFVDGLDNFVDDGLFFSSVAAPGGGAAVTNTLTFPQPVFGFGADFSISNDLLSVTLQGAEEDVTFLLSDFLEEGLNFGPEGFFGVVSDMPFSSIVFTSTDDFFTSFELDNLSFAPVPGPGALLLFATGLGASTIMKRRKARRAA